MKYASVQQFAIVQCDSAAQFEGELNARIRELSGKNPTVRFDGLTAYISYTESTKIPETLGDQYEVGGLCLTCRQCPIFEPILKADGTEDLRISYGECQYAEFGRTYKDMRACELLYKMIKSGEVGLCKK